MKGKVWPKLAAQSKPSSNSVGPPCAIPDHLPPDPREVQVGQRRRGRRTGPGGRSSPGCGRGGWGRAPEDWAAAVGAAAEGGGLQCEPKARPEGQLGRRDSIRFPPHLNRTEHVKLQGEQDGLTVHFADFYLVRASVCPSLFGQVKLGEKWPDKWAICLKSET